MSPRSRYRPFNFPLTPFPVLSLPFLNSSGWSPPPWEGLGEVFFSFPKSVAPNVTVFYALLAGRCATSTFHTGISLYAHLHHDGASLHNCYLCLWFDILIHNLIYNFQIYYLRFNSICSFIICSFPSGWSPPPWEGLGEVYFLPDELSHLKGGVPAGGLLPGRPIPPLWGSARGGKNNETTHVVGGGLLPAWHYINYIVYFSIQCGDPLRFARPPFRRDSPSGSYLTSTFLPPMILIPRCGAESC